MDRFTYLTGEVIPVPDVGALGPITGDTVSDVRSAP